MRFLLGLIIGIGLTIGSAYIYDSGTSADPSSSATAAKPMVNWDVVGSAWNRASSRVRKEWDRLAAK